MEARAWGLVIASVSFAAACEPAASPPDCASWLSQCDDEHAAAREQCIERQGCNVHAVGSCAWEACRDGCFPATEVAACIEEADAGCRAHACEVQCEHECAPTRHACQFPDVEGQCVTSEACTHEERECKARCKAQCEA